MDKVRKIKTIWRFLLVVGLCMSTIGEALAQNSFKLGRRVPDVERWIKSAFARGRVPPFSFVYDGQSSASFIRSWTYQAVAHGRT
ncbi:alpha-galactosidase, partial [Bacillus pumilus]